MQEVTEHMTRPGRPLRRTSRGTATVAARLSAALLAFGAPALAGPAFAAPALAAPAFAAPALAAPAVTTNLTADQGMSQSAASHVVTGPSATGPTLPVPTETLDPATTVGGPALAAMGVITNRPAGVPAPPKVTAVSYVIADLTTGEILAAKAPHARLLPASTTKALTAAYLLPTVDRTASYTATRADAAAGGTRIGLVPGLTYTGQQLFQALLMGSANDAAYMLARIAGGREATLAGENALARRLGAYDTTILDPSGLDAPGQTSSAYDLALIGRYAMADRTFRGLVATRHVLFPGALVSAKATAGTRSTPGGSPTTMRSQSGPRLTYSLDNHNGLLYNYPGTVGVKNGWTDGAQRTFIAAATRNGHTYLVTLMHGIDYSQWRPTASLLDWAFAHGTQVTPVGRLVAPDEVSPTVSATSSSSPPADTPSAAAAGALAVGALAGVSSRSAVPSVALAGGGGLAVVAVLAVWLVRRRRRTRRYPRRH